MPLDNKLNNFCILPFSTLSTLPDGSILPCCRYGSNIGNISHKSLKYIWNDKPIQELRRKFLENKKPKECWQCWVLEKSNSISLRQRSLNKFKIEKNIIQSSIKAIELKLSNLCNFRCRTCKPSESSNWIRDWKGISDFYKVDGYTYAPVSTSIYTHKFIEELINLSSNLKVLEFAGGEPLIDPLHYKILDSLPHKSNINLKYATNLSIIGNKIIKLWKQFKSIDFSISLDGYPKLNNYIRTCSNTKDIETNVFKIRKELGNKFTGRIALCFSVYNAYYLPESYKYFSIDLDLPVHGNIAYTPSFLNPQILPIKLKNIIAKKYKDYRLFIDYRYINKFYKKKIKEYLISNLNYMLEQDKSYLWKHFLRFSKILDKSRNTDLFQVLPIFKEYQ